MQMIARSHCLIIGPGGGNELSVLKNSVKSVQATSIAPPGWLSAPIDPLLDSQAGPADSVQIPLGGKLAWHTIIPSAGSYRVWIRVLRQPSASNIPVTVNGIAAGTVAPALSASVGYQWMPASVIHLSAGPEKIVLSGGDLGTRPEVAEVAVVRGSGTSGVPDGIQSSRLVQDVDNLDAGLYDNPSARLSGPLITNAWKAVSGVRVSNVHGAAATLIPTEATRSQFSLVNASLPKSINPNEPLAIKFQDAGNGAEFYLNLYFRDGSRKSFSFQDTTSKPRVLFFTPNEGGPAALANITSGADNSEVPQWNQLSRLTLSTNSSFSPRGDGSRPIPTRLEPCVAILYRTSAFPETLVIIRRKTNDGTRGNKSSDTGPSAGY